MPQRRLLLITAVSQSETKSATLEIAALKLLIDKAQLDKIPLPRRFTRLLVLVEGPPGGPYCLRGLEPKATIDTVRAFTLWLNKAITAKAKHDKLAHSRLTCTLCAQHGSQTQLRTKVNRSG